MQAGSKGLGARALAVVIAAGVVLLGRVAQAHDEAWSASDVVVDDRGVTWTVDVGLAGLAKLADLGAPVVGGEVQGFDAAALAAKAGVICAALVPGLTVQLGAQVVVPVCGTPVPRYETPAGGGPPHLVRVAQPLRFVGPAGFARVWARIGFFSSLTSSHRAVVKVRWAGELMQTTRLGVAELVLEKGQLVPSRWSSAWDFVRWGVHHILIGYDHIAFLLALLLVVPGLRALVTIVTAFTVAHSLTILLAAFGVVALPPALTEVLIAASIVYVAVENLVRGAREQPRRWLLVFAFGLVHGLGFAEVLRDRLEEAPGGIALSVVAFNVGVELGQLAIVALVFPLLRVLRARVGEAGEAKLVRVGSLPILLLGLYWLSVRLGG